MGLKRNLHTAQARLAEISDEMDAIGGLAEEENRDLTEDDNKKLLALGKEFDQAENSISVLKAQVERAERAAQARAQTEQLKSVPAGTIDATKIPARARYQKTRVFDSNFDAYASGRWLQSLGGNARAKEWCRTNGIMGAMTEGTDADGGYAVPDPMAATIIRLVEEHGVFRRFARNIPMTSDTLAVPKRSAGLTMYYPAEGAAITASDITFAQVNLTAIKYAQLAIMSTELSEDAVISMTDLITTEMAYNFAYHEDLNGFLGDGTGTYGTITGIASALAAGSTVTLGTGDTAVSDIVLDDVRDVVAKLPNLSGINPRWYMSRYTYHFIVDLLVALGGTDQRQYEAGGDMMLQGYPVTFTNVLPGSGAAASDVPIVFGDLNMGALLGTRRNVTIRTLTELYAANDQIGLVATSRSDTVIHDVGDATNAGSIVMMKLAAA